VLLGSFPGHLEEGVSWEDLMAVAAQVRQLERERLERERAAAEWAEYERQRAEEQRAEFEGGPPDGCHDCYFWGLDPFGGGNRWWHRPIYEGDCACYHSCHAEPVDCAPVAIG
jgi:hypothetical protein